MKKTLIKYIITFAIISVITFLFFLGQNLFNLTDESEIYRVLTDGFTFSGILFLGAGLLVVSSNGGTFDMLAYGVMSLFYLFLKNPKDRKYDTFYDYRLAKQSKKRSFSHLLLVGGIFFLVGIIFLIIYLGIPAQEVIQ